MAYDKIQYIFMINVLKKLGIERSHLIIVEALHDRHIAHIILNGGKLRAFILKLRIMQGCSLTTNSIECLKS
jgi:hypothetical protein